MKYNIKVGDKVNLLTVVEDKGVLKTKSGYRSHKWLCRCECGGEILVRQDMIGSGKAKSCGCLQVKALLDFAESRPHLKDKYKKEYYTWCNIKQRISNPNYPYFAEYSTLEAYKPWMDSFEEFIKDVGKCPNSDPDLSLDRIDNNVGYFPGNVRWATKAQQSRNQGIRKDNCSGAVGVYLSDGRYFASWSSLDGKQKTKSFSISKYGEQQAFDLAVAKRKEMISELNEQGAGYSETHGLPRS